MTVEQSVTVPELDLEAIRRLCDAATPGPWKHYHAKELRPGLGNGTPVNEVNGADGDPVVFWTGFDRGRRSKKQVKADARFISQARTIIPALLDHIARLSQPQDAPPVRDGGVK